MIDVIGKYLAEGFALGLTLGTTCAATCGPMYMPYLMQRKQTVTKSIINIFEISAGRFVSYVAFGMIAGAIGSAVGAVLQREWFSSAAYILFSILLLMSAFQTHKKEKGGCSVSKWSKFADRPFLFGLLTGISMCPSFFGAMTAAFDTGGWFGGGAIFAGFFFGSSIFLLPFAVAGLAGNIKTMRKIAVIASVAVAAYFIGKGTMGFIHLFQTQGSAKSVSTQEMAVENVFDSKPLYIIADSAISKEVVSAVKAKKSGTVQAVNSADSLPDSCHILILHGAVKSPEQLRKPGRFVIIIPPVGTMSRKAYAEMIVTYLGQYLFKRDDEKGTYFDMSAFLEKKH